MFEIKNAFPPFFNKKSRQTLGGVFMRSNFVERNRLRLLDKTGFERFYRNPNAFDAAVRHFRANALQIRFEGALGLFDELEADTAALLALTFVNDFASRCRTFACNCTNT